MVKSVDIQEVLKKYEINIYKLPFIYSVKCYQSTVLISTETGHVINFNYKEPKKPKFILEASLYKVIQAKLAESFNEKLLLTLSADKSFSLFDYVQRKDGKPIFLQKYNIGEVPTWI